MKPLFATLGFVFFILGAIGVFLPVLPTTPFLLLASFCFAKSSKRFNDWFLSRKLYKKHLEGFVKNRSMTLRTKVGLCSFASCMLLIAFFLTDILFLRIFIIGLIAFKYYYFIFRIKTIKPAQQSEEEEESAILVAKES